MNKVSDDKKPMTGTWYVSTIDGLTMAKVISKTECGPGCDNGACTIVMSGGRKDTLTYREFANAWEMS
jgi:hypothetical protein